MNKHQRGFGIIEIILVVVILLLVASLGYFAWHSFTKPVSTPPVHSSASSTPANPDQTTTPADSMQTVKINDYHIQFTVPATYPKLSYKIDKSSGSTDLKILAAQSIGANYACQDPQSGYFMSLVSTSKEQIQALGDDPNSSYYTYVGNDTYWEAGLLGPCTDSTASGLIHLIIKNIKPLSTS